MSGFEADLPAIDAAASVLRDAADALDVSLAPAGDLGPGRLNAVVSTLLTHAEADVARARDSVSELAGSVTRVRDSYVELDTGAASRFDQGSW